MTTNSSQIHHPWEQREGEPAKWFERFTRLRLLPTNQRSIEAAHRAELADRKAKESTGKQKKAAQRPSKQWYENAQKWEWDARIAAWDKHWLALEAARIEEEKVEERRRAREQAAKRREQMIEAMTSPLFRAAAAFKPEEATLAEMQRLFTAILTESRLEFEPLPVVQFDVKSNGNELKALTLSADRLGEITEEARAKVLNFQKKFQTNGTEG